MVRNVLVCLFVLVAASASAQTPYVAGTIGGDVVRSNHSESNVSQASTPGGSEVLSGSLRVGTSVGENWGVEFEFVRSGESRQSGPVGLPILADRTVPSVTTPTSIMFAGSTITIPIAFSTETRQSRSDYDAVAWVRQRAGGSVDLIYLGGLAFSRQHVEITQTFPTVIGLFAPVPGGAFRTTVVNYDTHPLVGAEARIGLTSHMKLIPGIRLQGLSDGWLLRPYAGLGWFF